MATVYLARLSGVAGFSRLVAIKRLHPHLAREPEFVEMFLDEARLAARIHHPNVVPIQEVGESPQGYYLVMDYVEGDTLARMLSRASLAKTQIPYGVTIRVLLDVLAGLHAAHELTDDLGKPLAIVHRDVSPQNILVGVDGIARVVDFGVARAASRLTTTRSGQLKGKLSYMAPEQARGGAVDRRADLFSCGVVLWEALALRRLFKGEGEADTLNRVLYDPILPPSSVRPDVPRALEGVVMKALAREVDERYATAQEFADDLEAVARALACVGSVRDVAQCLDEVVGADLSQQREIVRAWLARSEPSATSVPRPPRPMDSLVTRVEGSTKSEPSAPPAVPEKVSSVSSAVLVAATGSQPTAPVLAPKKSRAGLVVGATLAAAVLAGVSVWGATRWPGRHAKGAATETASPPGARAATAPVSAEPAPSSLAAAPASSAAPSSLAAAPAAPAAPAASAPSAAASAPAKPRVRSRGGATARPAPTGTATSVPDDLSTNPYR